ncbi:hypothetical protein D3C71_1844400 [compost metagenome]
MPAGRESTIFRILPALGVQVLQNGTAIGGGITVFAIAHAMPHRAAHVIHHAGRHRFDAGIHHGVV